MIVAGGNADDTADDQRLAVSLGIPVLPLKFVMDQIIAENKSLKRKEEFDGKTNSRRSSKRQKINGDLPVGSSPYSRFNALPYLCLFYHVCLHACIVGFVRSFCRSSLADSPFRHGLLSFCGCPRALFYIFIPFLTLPCSPDLHWLFEATFFLGFALHIIQFPHFA